MKETKPMSGKDTKPMKDSKEKENEKKKVTPMTGGKPGPTKPTKR